MDSAQDLTALSHNELVSRVLQLQRQLEEREHEIVRLKQQLLEQQFQDVQNTQDVPETAGNKETVPSEDAQQPGSQEDLLSQLEKIYPGEE